MLFQINPTHTYKTVYCVFVYMCQLFAACSCLFKSSLINTTHRTGLGGGAAEMGKRGHPLIIPATVVGSIGIIIVLFVPIRWGSRDIVGAAVHGDFQAPSRDDDDQKFCP
jgi:hypothetical protein